MDNQAPAQIHMAPVTTTRTLAIPGYATSDGVFCADPSERRSGTFAAGGYDWSIGYRPNSLYLPQVQTIDLRLQLQSTGCRVTASFSARLLDPTGSLPPWELAHGLPGELDLEPGHDDSLVITLTKASLNTGPDPRYLTRGGLIFECTVTVLMEETPPPPPAALSARANAPASGMMQQLGEIYATGDGADVTFSVKGEIFRAHKVILAMRSPAFKAQLYGGKMMGSAGQPIEVEDMVPDVFKALLCFIYTDALPARDEGNNKVDEEDATELISHLLVAADRYGVERLRILCEHKLCDLVDADSFVKMLVFAEEQHCGMLRDACIEFMATSDRMGEVVVRKEYVQLCSTYPMLLIDALEKSNRFS